MSDVGSDRCRNTQVSDRTGSTVLINCQAMITHEIHSAYLFPMGFFANNSLSG